MALLLENMRQEIYDKILEKIMNGSYPAGSRLVNRKLAQELGVSITPVREALNNLAQEGIINSVPHLGFFVKDFDMNEIVKVYQVRECIEPFVARLAAENATERDVQRLREIHVELVEAVEQGNMHEVAQKEQEFQPNQYCARGKRACHQPIHTCAHKGNSYQHPRHPQMDHVYIWRNVRYNAQDRDCLHPHHPHHYHDPYHRHLYRHCYPPRHLKSWQQGKVPSLYSVSSYHMTRRRICQFDRKSTSACLSRPKHPEWQRPLISQ